MSYRYQEIVVPEAEHYLHRPSASELIAVLDCLASSGWCESSPTDEGYRSLEKAKAAATLAPEHAFHALLQGGATGSSPRDWPDDEPTFLPDLCEEVSVVSSPSLLMLPGDMNGATLVCPSCEQDMFGSLRSQAGATAEVAAPATCPGCGAILELGRLVLETDSTEDDAPFYHFSVVLQALHSPTVEMVYLDPEFMADLSKACGVPLRSTGRLL